MTPPRQGRVSLLMATACGGLFTYGILSALLDATIPELRARLGFPLEASGWLFSFFYLPQILAVFMAGLLVDRLGSKPLHTGGCLLAGLAVVGIARAPAYGLLATLLFFSVWPGASSAVARTRW